jgi:hypothetical protein
MLPFFAVVKLTIKSALRSHIFQLLLALLLACVIVLPLTIAGDGTAYGYIQVSLKYNLSAVAFILSLSTVWLCCGIMTVDVENYQLHMLLSKPVSRVIIWLGKCFGVVLINLILLFISCAVIYGIISFQFSRKGFPQKEKKKIANEVLVGRRVYSPELPDLSLMIREEYRERMAKAESAGAAPGNKKAKSLLLKEIRKQLIARMSEIKFRMTRLWRYKGLPPGLESPIYLRYRTYIGKISSKEQRETYGLWAVEVTRRVEPDSGKKQKKDDIQYKTFWEKRTYLPEKIMCGIFNEIKMKPDVVGPEGSVNIAFTNFDPQKKNLYFQVVDGPKMLIKVTGFFENYFRAVIVIVLQLIILAGISCAAASFLSMPTAVFMVVSYLLFGSFAGFLVGSGIDTPGLGFADYLAYYVSKILLWIIIPMQNFQVSSLVSNGELVEFSHIGKLFVKYFVMKGLPLFLVGIWLYRRREMGLVIRK